MASNEIHSDSDSDSSDSSDRPFVIYSGAAKRFKHEKQTFCTRGVVNLVDDSSNNHKSTRKRKSPSPAPLDDSSDEEVFRDVNAKEDCEVDLEDSQISNYKQIATLEDVEQYINMSPETSFCAAAEEHRTTSSASIVPLEETELEEDPLFCDHLNESALDQSLDDDEKVTIKVRFTHQKVWRIELRRGDYFKVLIQELAEKAGENAEKISLYFNNKLLDPYDSLKTVPLKISDIIEATVSQEVAVSASDENMLEFKVQSQNRNSQVIISIRAQDPMKVLMEKYAQATENELSKLTFHFDGDKLDGEDTPTTLDLDGGECIDVFIKE